MCKKAVTDSNEGLCSSSQKIVLKEGPLPPGSSSRLLRSGHTLHQASPLFFRLCLALGDSILQAASGSILWDKNDCSLGVNPETVLSHQALSTEHSWEEKGRHL